MFAGEGGPERTNRRFHYVSIDMPGIDWAQLLIQSHSGEDPDFRPIFMAKVGNSGVSICSLTMQKIIQRFWSLRSAYFCEHDHQRSCRNDLRLSFMNVAIDQQCEFYIREHNLEHLVEETLRKIWCSPNPKTFLKVNYPRAIWFAGLLLLGCTGDEVLDQAQYAAMKSQKHCQQFVVTVQADIPQRGSGSQSHLFRQSFHSNSWVTFRNILSDTKSAVCSIQYP